MTHLVKRPAVGQLLKTSRDRCRAQHGLRADSAKPILRLQDSEVDQRRERFTENVGGTAPELDRETLIPDRSRYCLLVSDHEGIVIESYAPDGYERDFQRFGIAAGSLWNERNAGTNGIGMALSEGRVMTVSGKEHFYSCFHDFACSSAPLLDAQNNMIGSLTLVGTARRRAEEIALCEQTLRRTSRQFQARLFRNFHAQRMTARLTSRDPDSLRMYETVVACDEQGVVVANLPLWRDAARPAEHEGLAGRHLSELQDLQINVRGPAIIPPRRRIRPTGTVARAEPSATARMRRNTALQAMAEHGGDLAILTERALKLLSGRVPLLICGEAGLNAEGFARDLLQALELASPFGMTLDAARNAGDGQLHENLQSLQFLQDYPVGTSVPTMILNNVERLDKADQQALDAFLSEPGNLADGTTERRRPVLVFTSALTWEALSESTDLLSGLAYRIGQGVIELPALRARDRGAVLDQLLRDEFDAGVEVGDKARAVLESHDWPGNLDEMRAVLRESLICGNGSRINLVDLPPRLSRGHGAPVKPDPRAALQEALDSTGWNISKAARLLGKSRATVNRWIIDEGLRRPE